MQTMHPLLALILTDLVFNIWTLKNHTPLELLATAELYLCSNIYFLTISAARVRLIALISQSFTHAFLIS